jgi:hypothetical protein
MQDPPSTKVVVEMAMVCTKLRLVEHSPHERVMSRWDASSHVIGQKSPGRWIPPSSSKDLQRSLVWKPAVCLSGLDDAIDWVHRSTTIITRESLLVSLLVLHCAIPL